EGAIGVTPERGSPGNAAAVGLANGALIDLDAQARRGQQLEVAVDELQRFGVSHVVEHLGALVVVNADALLLDEEVRGRERDLQAGGKSEWPERAVRGELHVIDLGQGRDATNLGD